MKNVTVAPMMYNRAIKARSGSTMSIRGRSATLLSVAVDGFESPAFTSSSSYGMSFLTLFHSLSYSYSSESSMSHSGRLSDGYIYRRLLTRMDLKRMMRKMMIGQARRLQMCSAVWQSQVNVSLMVGWHCDVSDIPNKLWLNVEVVKC